MVLLFVVSMIGVTCSVVFAHASPWWFAAPGVLAVTALVGASEPTSGTTGAPARKPESTPRPEDAERAWLHHAIAAAQHFTGWTDGDREVPLRLKRGERAYAVVADVALIEARAEPGHYVGGSQGFSLRLMDGVWYRAGATRGTYTVGQSRPAPTDTGLLVITNRRVVFEGSTRTRQWEFSKLLGAINSADAPMTILHVSNRERASGFWYGAPALREVRLALSLALADYEDERPAVEQALRSELTRLEAGQ